MRLRGVCCSWMYGCHTACVRLKQQFYGHGFCLAQTQISMLEIKLSGLQKKKVLPTKTSHWFYNKSFHFQSDIMYHHMYFLSCSSRITLSGHFSSFLWPHDHLTYLSFFKPSLARCHESLHGEQYLEISSWSPNMI